MVKNTVSIKNTASIMDTYPEVAQWIDDPALRTTLAPQSNKRVMFRCPHGHTWEKKLSNVTNQYKKKGVINCDYCNPPSNVVIPGVNDLATTHPDNAAQWLIDPSDSTRISIGSGLQVMWRCPHDAEHVVQRSANQVLKVNADGTVHFKCRYCAHRDVLVGNNDLATTHPDLARQIADPQPDGTSAYDIARSITAGHNKSIMWSCDKHTTPVTWKASPNTRSLQNNNCPVCTNTLVIPGVNDLATTHPELTAELLNPQPDGTPARDIATTISRGSHHRPHWYCTKHKKSWQTTVKDRVRGTGCPDCACAGTSQQEDELYSVITTLLPDTTVLRHYLINGRTGLPGGSPTVDIFIPSMNLAIEFNGVYWHSSAVGLDKKYHYNKSQLCQTQNINLIHIWSDDWINKKETVITMLAHKLHATHNLHLVINNAQTAQSTYFARKLIIQQVDNSAAKKFLNENHIQGAVTATYHYGLCDSSTDDIRALLSIRSPQNNARMRRSAGEWEIQRYATHGNVPGGFTRLLAHAERELKTKGEQLNKWISFSANDVSDGNMYIIAGFKADAAIPPDYSYIGGLTNNIRRPKEKFQKRFFRDTPDLLWQPDWTESQCAEANKLYRIYDAGKTRWIKAVN